MSLLNAIVRASQKAKSVKTNLDEGLLRQVENQTQPITGWHSTNEIFDTFDNPQIGYHFANNPELAKRASEKGNKFNTQQFEYELDIKNPFVIEKANLSPSGWSPYQLLDNMDEGGLIKSQKEYDNILDNIEKLEDDLGNYKIDDNQYNHEVKRMFRDLLSDKGYDGIKWWNDFDNSPTMEQLSKAKWDDKLGGYVVPGKTLDPDWSYIAFSNKQIKRKK